ncbi:MAG TPA: alpha/beta fold hydrolase [Gemmatimonadaceae bacterium]|nr:alpha/beta fold hydrolase [Gemmatimonadaceae bacterium]
MGRGPVVYLVHGWGSRGARLGAFAAPLLESGHQVVTFDAPGHGESGRGPSSMPEFARALRAVVERHGPARAVIAHSLGAAATVLAARWGLAVERVALLAPPSDPAAFADIFAAVLGACGDVMARMRASSERRLRFSWAELDVCAAAACMTAPLLVVHDEGDDVVPFTEGAAIAASWPGARLLLTTGLGHRGVARDGRIVGEVVRFVLDGLPSRGSVADATRLEHEPLDHESGWR